MKASGLLREYSVIGRRFPTKEGENPPLFRMVIYAPDEVQAKSRFWYYLRLLKKVKKANGQVIECRQVHENHRLTAKNYGIYIRYHSRTGQHNMYKEYRDLTRAGAVTQCYRDMASKHRARATCVQIMRVQQLKPRQCKRAAVKQFHSAKVAFPLAHRVRNKKLHHPRFAGKRPNTLY
ncbi:hypothetical protein ACOME3_003957 [Neoechinorhynchus agilis]